MKLFAFKQQKWNPDKLVAINGEMPWQRTIIEEIQRTAYESDNWIVLDSDDFSGYLLSIGVDPSKQFN